MLNRPRVTRFFRSFGLRISAWVQLLSKRRRYKLEIEVLKSVIASNMKAIYSRAERSESLRKAVNRNMKFHRITAGFLEFWKYRTMVQHTQWDGYDMFERTVKKYGSAVVCSIHYGNYYLLPFEAAKLGYRVVAIVGDQHRQYELIGAAAASLGLPLEIIKSEELSLLRLLRELKNGKLAYLLIDEVGGAAVNEKLLRVPFMDQFLRFKRGIGALHYYSGLPLVPVVNEITGNRSSIIHVREIVKPLRNSEARQTAIDRTVIDLFRLFEADVRRDPAQWQKWMDLKRYVRRGRAGAESGPGFDLVKRKIRISGEAFRLLRDRKGYLMIDMNNGRYFSVDRISGYAVKLMYRHDEFSVVASRLRKKFGLPADAADDYVRRIVSLTGTDGEL